MFVLEPHRGNGVGRGIVRTLLEHPDIRTIRRTLLITRDAHSLCEPFGFERVPREHNLISLGRPIAASPEGSHKSHTIND